MKEFVSIGEILVDCVPYQVAPQALYQMNPGGAPANVACVMARLGHSAGFIGRVGNDVFGSECMGILADSGVDVDCMLVADGEPTTLALVCLDSSGNRSFSFYRNGSADVGLSCVDIDSLNFPAAKIFHFGSVSLSVEPARSATIYGVELAKKAGSLISFDPNLRPPLWADLDDAKEQILKAAALADIIKLSEEEGEFLFGETDAETICRIVEERFNPAMVVVTLAERGCICSMRGKVYTAAAYEVETVDTTGAGDCFWGGMLHCLLQSGKNLEELTEDEITHMLDFSNAIGSLVTTKKGAIPAIPALSEIEQCMAKTRRSQAVRV